MTQYYDIDAEDNIVSMTQNNPDLFEKPLYF